MIIKLAGKEEGRISMMIGGSKLRRSVREARRRSGNQLENRNKKVAGE